MKVKASHSHKGPYDFDLLVPVQELTSQKMVSLIISLHVFIFVYLHGSSKTSPLVYCDSGTCLSVLLPVIYQMLTDFQNSFIVRLCSKFVITS